MSPTSNEVKALPALDVDNFLTLRLLYHLWRVDSAARAFPRHLTVKADLDTAKARWTIGLTLEMVCLPSL